MTAAASASLDTGASKILREIPQYFRFKHRLISVEFPAFVACFVLLVRPFPAPIAGQADFCQGRWYSAIPKAE